MLLLGLIDDVRDISAPAKVAGTVVAGVVLVNFGVTMFLFRLPFLGVTYLGDDWIPLVTVLWILGISTAINLIDGLDGLAAGIVAIGAFSFFLYSQHLSEQRLLLEPNIGPLIAIITVGACVGFLPHNFNPARIFMGDSGALFLGLLMAVSTSVVGGRRGPRCRDRLGRPGVLLPRAIVHPAVHPGRCRSSTRCGPSRAGPAAAEAWRRPTRATCTIG
ncbi:MAG: MraY family glycosyltransferase [Ilumatobacteraceae bacterium]